jgi:hypothetical protein
VNVKILVTIALVGFVLASIAMLIVDEIGAGNRDEPSALSGERISLTNPGNPGEVVTEQLSGSVGDEGPEADSIRPGEQSKKRVVAYYFHYTVRCPTCRSIEQRSRNVLTEQFADELQAGVLEWGALNVEQPENEHFVYDYELTSPSLVLVLLAGEAELEWKVLDDTWNLVHEEDALEAYVYRETTSFLEGAR